MKVTQLSAIADSFPATQVHVDDLLTRPYRFGGRGADGIDCLGIVLEVYRRAGLELPDPLWPGESEETFAGVFEPVSAADTLYDVIYTSQDHAGVLVVVEPGIALSARPGVGVYRARVAALRRVPTVRYYRLKASETP